MATIQDALEILTGATHAVLTDGNGHVIAESGPLNPASWLSRDNAILYVDPLQLKVVSWGTAEAFDILANQVVLLSTPVGSTGSGKPVTVDQPHLDPHHVVALSPLIIESSFWELGCAVSRPVLAMKGARTCFRPSHKRFHVEPTYAGGVYILVLPTNSCAHSVPWDRRCYNSTPWLPWITGNLTPPKRVDLSRCGSHPRFTCSHPKRI